jgi:hypothetical protein
MVKVLPRTEPSDEYACPSAQLDMQDAKVLGVMERTADGPRLSYLTGRADVSPDMVGGLAPEHVGRVLRISARCESSKCGQFANGRCGLGQRVAQMMADVVDTLPSCRIRPTCRWYAEQGGAVCLKCPQVVTQVSADDAAMVSVAVPPAA